MSVRKMQLQLDINANVGQAKAQIRSMQQALTDAITASNSSQLSITPQIQQAQQSALKLKVALQNATNVDTGKLNLTKFRAELKKSGITVEQYAAQMRALGPAGTQAFAQVTRAVQQGNTAVFSLSTGLKKLTQTFMNTMRWQITSSILMGITSAAQKTVQHMAELDKALTDISIVTGKSDQEMARFAKTAHTAAKELSVTALEYTQASLIYFQQGLSSKEVKERTEVTTKLAKVVGENAETVSEWMTAIWNNFDDGSVTLERYADKIAALGAATASSADEIAGGLEKFAAVAETVGLSFDYAAAALATITAETRQSEDVVGTALKTILARMENLKLGETLEDGTTLGQYAEALMKVGVSIKDSNGALKDMDNILDEVGVRWQTLAKDEQVALAQGVAGIRQYNQFIALMANWDVMQQNVDIVKNSIGTLESQFLIYEDSVEGAQARMKEQGDILKESFFSTNDMSEVYDSLKRLLEYIGNLVENFGGLKGIINLVIAGLMRMYQPQLMTFFSNLGTSIANVWGVLTGRGAVVNQQLQTTFTALNEANLSQLSQHDALTNVLTEESKLYTDIEAASASLSAVDRTRLNMQLDILANERANLLLLQEQNQERARAVDRTDARVQAKGVSGLDTHALRAGARALGGAQEHGNQALRTIEQARPLQGNGSGVLAVGGQGRTDLVASLKSNMAGIQGQVQAFEQLEKEGIELGGAVKTINDGMATLQQHLQAFSKGNNVGLDTLEQDILRITGAIEAAGGAALKAKQDAMMQSYSAQPGSMADEMQGIAAMGYSSSARAPTNITKSIANLDASAIGDPVLEGEVRLLQEHSAALAKDRTELEAKMAAEKQAIATADENIATLEARRAGLDENSAEYQELTAQIEANRAAIKKSEGSLKQLQTLKGKNTTATKILGRQFEDLSAKVRKLKPNIAETTEQLEQMVQAEQQNGAGAVQMGANTQQLAEKIKTLKAEVASASANVKNAWMGMFTSFAMGVMSVDMLANSFANLADQMARGEDVDWTAMISSTLMSLMMLLPVFTNLNKLLDAHRKKKAATKALEDAHNASKAAGVAATGAQMAADEAQERQKEKHKKKALLRIPIFLGENIAKNWILGLAIAAVVAGLVAVTVSKVNKKEKEREEEKDQEAKEYKTEEAKNSLKEAQDSTKTRTTAIDKYKEALDEYKTTGANLEALATAAGELGTVFDDAQLQALALSGQFKLLNEEVQQLNARDIAGELTKVQTANITFEQQFRDTMMEGLGGDTNNDNQYGLSVKRTDVTTKLIKNFAEQNADELATAGIDMTGGQSGRGDDYIKILSNVDMDNPAEFLAAYEWVSKLIEYLSSKGVKSNNETYQHLIEWMAKSKDTYTNYKEGHTAEVNLLAESKIQGSKLSTTSDLTTYLTEREALLSSDEAKADPALKAALENTFAKYATNSDFELIASNFDRQVKEIEKAGIKDIISAEDLKKMYLSASHSEILALAGISFENIESKEDFNFQYAEAKKSSAKAAKHEMAETYKITADESDTYTTILASQNKELAENVTLLEEVSEAHIQLHGELQEFQKVWNETNDDLLNGTGQSYAFAVSKTANALEELLGSKEDLTDFVRLDDAQELLADFMSGNLQAYDLLQKRSAEFIISQKSALYTGLTDIGTFINTSTMQVGDVIEGTQIADISKYVKEKISNPNDSISEEYIRSIFAAAGYEITLLADHSIGEVKRVKDSSSIDPSLFKQQEEKYKKDLKNLEKERDYFFQITQTLNKYFEALDKIGKKKENAFGAKRLQYIKEEQKLLEKTLEAKKEEQKIARQQLRIGADNIRRYGFTTDEAGYINNYDAVYDDMEEQYKEDLAKYKGTEKYEQVKEDWEEFVNSYEDYNNRLNKLNQTEMDILDAEQKMLDTHYEELEYTIEVNVRVNDQALKLLEFQLEHIKDDAYEAAEAIQKMGEQFDTYGKNVQVHKDALMGWFEKKGITDQSIIDAFIAGNAQPLMNTGIKFNDKDITFLENALSGMMDGYEGMKGAYDSAFEAMDNTFAKVNEEFDSLTDVLEHSKSVLESFTNINELVGAEITGLTDEVITGIFDSQQEIANKEIKVAEAKLIKNREMLATAQAEREKAQTDEDRKKWDESIAHYEQEVRASEQAWLQALQTGLEAANARREQAVNTAINKFLKEVTGYNSMEEMQQIYDQQKQLRDLYVADYEKAHALSKLSRQLDKTLNDTKNIAAKERLLELENRINKAKEAGTKLSQYELSNLEREYQIELAKMALEEAQNSKSTVRLQRNMQGGMAYIYTTDENALADAQQKYEDAIYASQKANDEWLRSCEEGLMQATATYIEQLAVISTATYESEEERDEAIARLNEWYLGQQEFYLGQVDIVLGNNESLYNDHMVTMSGYYNQNDTNFWTMTEDMKESGRSFITDLSQTFLKDMFKGLLGKDGLNGQDSAQTLYEKLQAAIGDGKTSGLLWEIEQAQEAWKTQTSNICGNIGTTLIGTEEENGEGGLAGNFKSLYETVKKYLDPNGTNTVGSILDDVSSKMDDIAKIDFTSAATQIGKLKTDNLLDTYTYITGIANAVNQLSNGQINLDVNTSSTDKDQQSNNIRMARAWMGFNAETDEWGIDQARAYSALTGMKLDNAKDVAQVSKDIVDKYGNANSSWNYGKVGTVNESMSGERFAIANTIDNKIYADTALSESAASNLSASKALELFNNDNIPDPEYGGERIIVSNDTDRPPYKPPKRDEEIVTDTQQYQIVFKDENGKESFITGVTTANGVATPTITNDPMKYDAGTGKTALGDIIKDTSFSLDSVDGDTASFGKYSIRLQEIENGKNYTLLKGTTPKTFNKPYEIGTFVQHVEYDDWSPYTYYVKSYDAAKGYQLRRLYGGKVDEGWFKANGSKYYDLDNGNWRKDKRTKYNFTDKIYKNKLADRWVTTPYDGEGVSFTLPWNGKKGSTLEIDKFKHVDGQSWYHIVGTDFCKVSQAYGASNKKQGGWIPTWDFVHFLEIEDSDFKDRVSEGAQKEDRSSFIENGIGNAMYFYDKKNLDSYDTGGYTGAWGPEGRLAMLHQKEIILNAHDTENILQVVDIVRQMAANLDLTGLSLNRNLGNLITNATINAMPHQIDQNVTIKAEFPNVTDRNEIKEAFGDLVNLAAQYATRYN